MSVFKTLSHRALGIIPARGGSKGVPRKNVRLLAGKPLIAHTILAARDARCLDRVVVSTDDREIARVSEKYGAEVVNRPADLSGDSVASEAALLHALDHLRDTQGFDPGVTVFLQCTSPLTTPEDIEGTVEALLRADADSALSVAPFHHFLWQTDEAGGALGINHNKAVRELRAARAPQFLETGGVYAMRTRGFRQARHRFFGKTAVYVTPRERCLEIDEPADFVLAEYLMQGRLRQEQLRCLPDPIDALVLDFDGVMTDNRVMVFQGGGEAVLCHRGDGWGLSRLKGALPILVLSTERNKVVQARCDKLGIPCLQGIMDKWSALRAWLVERGFDAARVVYVGNDVNDLECMENVGCAVAVADAHPDILTIADIVLSIPGGQGAVREVTDLIFQRRKAGLCVEH